jgi:hypothetical protein
MSRGATSAFDDVAALAAWRAHDTARAVHALDEKAIAATDAPRALVLELLVATDREPRDLFTACARLGRLLADAGASPTLAATTLDGALASLPPATVTVDDPRLLPARASILEGYVAASTDAERTAARRLWEYPACAVRLDATTIALTAGFPTDDADALSDWAGRVASSASRAGVKRAVLSGAPPACAELEQALSFVGIERLEHVELADRGDDKAGWLRFPFWKASR